jgi:hypothetical protein
VASFSAMADEFTVKTKVDSGRCTIFIKGVIVPNLMPEFEKAVVQLQDLNNQKLTLESSIKELDSAIAKKKTKIQVTNYATEVERDADKNALQGLVTDRSTQAELYASVVKEIDARGKDSSVASILPKYRVRGFWPLPEEKSTPETGTQKIIKFIVRYRYLSEDGAANPVDQFTYTDNTGQSQGAAHSSSGPQRLPREAACF